MARTRTQTGTITTQKYDYETLRTKGESKIKKGGKGKGKGKGKEDSDKPRDQSPVPDFDHEPTPQPEPGKSNATGGNTYWPSVIFGEQEKEGLSALERADRLVIKWETILDEHKKHLPEAVPHIEAQLKEACTTRDKLKEDVTTGDEATPEKKQDKAVQERIETLLNGLKSSKNEQEKENIRGAIEAYRSGTIGFSKHFTLIWAGKVVDVADKYADFAIGRKERLDRYEKEHGPHWLWFESPLDAHPESKSKAMRCAVVERVASRSEFGLYYINQGFWKREREVTRMPQTGYGAGMKPVPQDPNNIGFITGPGGTVNCGPPGPKLTIRSLLDSGATYPSLYASDFRSLGVYPAFYPAQSLVELQTANGIITERIYEMHVELTAENGQSLVDPMDPVNPAYPLYIGGLTPVCLIGTDDSPPLDPNGLENGIRLSGIMPLLAAYISSTPSKNIILFGENRNDVLGAHKIPPVRRWMVGLSQDPSDRSHWVKFQDPMITFSHRRGLILDQDTGRGASTLTVNAGMGPLERSEVFDPRGDYLRTIAAGRPGGTIDPSVLNP